MTSPSTYRDRGNSLYMAAQRMLRASEPRMSQADFARTHAKLGSAGYVQLALVLEQHAGPTDAPDFKQKFHRMRLVLWRDLLSGGFDDGGLLLDEYYATVLSLAGDLVDYLATDKNRYSIDRLLERCWIPKPGLEAWIERNQPAEPLCISKPRRSGPKPALRRSVADRMKSEILTGGITEEELRESKGIVLQKLYCVSPNTAKAARNLALSELGGNGDKL